MTEVIDWNVARLEVIEIVLKGWTALDLQIQHNPVDKEIRQWLPQPIADVMKAGPCVDELEEWLAGLLDTNFSLICEDDSCFEVARHLIEIERIVGRKDKDRLLAYVQRLPQASGATASIFEQNNDEDDSSEDENENDEMVQKPTNSQPRKNDIPSDDDMEVEDGWNVVRK